MKHSVLSKVIGTSIISLNMIILPLLPVSAQTNTTSNNSSATTNPDANVGNTSSSSNSSSNSNSSSSSDTSSNPSASNAPNTSASASSAPSNAPASASPTSSNAPQGNNQQKSDGSGIGLLGLLGLVGLASLFRRPARHATVSTTNGTDLQANLNSVGDRLHDGINQAGTETHNLLGQLNERIDEFKTHRAQEKEIKQIKNALGRPSKRVILDREDRVILNVGELITNQSIERARAADMLDVLLDSVDTHEPEIENREHIAPVTGEASLEKREQESNNS